MANYIDGFVFPLSRNHLDAYRQVAEQVADIWKEHGAIAYFEYVGEDLHLAGTRSFSTCVNTQEDEVVVFGWVAFDSRETRDLANKKVAADPRMPELMAPLTDPARVVFEAGRMFYGGFQSFIQKE